MRLASRSICFVFAALLGLPMTAQTVSTGTTGLVDSQGLLGLLLAGSSLWFLRSVDRFGESKGATHHRHPPHGNPRIHTK